jgi:hypothetical protein
MLKGLGLKKGPAVVKIHNKEVVEGAQRGQGADEKV